MNTIITWAARLAAWAILSIIAAQVVAGWIWSFDEYYSVGELQVKPNPAKRGDIRLSYDGGPRREFLGSYSAVVRRHGTHEIACEARSGRFTYKPGTPRPIPLRLSWWAPSDPRCEALPGGVYQLETCWTVHDRLSGFLPASTRCVQTLPFRVVGTE